MAAPTHAGTADATMPVHAIQMNAAAVNAARRLNNGHIYVGVVKYKWYDGLKRPVKIKNLLFDFKPVYHVLLGEPAFREHGHNAVS